VVKDVELIKDKVKDKEVSKIVFKEGSDLDLLSAFKETNRLAREIEKLEKEKEENANWTWLELKRRMKRMLTSMMMRIALLLQMIVFIQITLSLKSYST
jgi:hypothetical protein